MRSIWSGAISFGLVHIPVKLYSASVTRTLDFDLLHKEDLSPIRYARVCTREEKEVPYEDIVKGYEFQKGQYVVLSESDFKNANARKTKTIEIENFTASDQIEEIYFEKPYYLEPEEGAEKSYALLRTALEDSKKVGVAKFVLRNRERLGVIKARDSVIVLAQLRFESEIRDAKGLRIPQVKVEQREMEMALALIEKLTGDFKIIDYKDTFTNELMRVITEKAQGVVPKQKGEPPKPTEVRDLMNALRQSLEKSAPRAA